ncbi:hypothetical protein [uncultured Tateyamaria sp.]|uniref:hypothetical protein n=1 Tax=uncultured Tateyamaria sp. TaxID=455651 RepID=UPI00261FA4D8|nr:hypothetical protein [uncultured Tateyamaria sp.]
MINLNECATIAIAVQTALDAIADDEKSDAWNTQTNDVKAFKVAIMDHGIEVQNTRCVWCTLEVAEEGHRTAHRDHIAPKGKHGRWTFEPLNLAISCEYCNGFKVKGEVETVVTVAANYADVEFLIVHPYLDNTAEHIRFVDNGAGYPIVIEGLSPRGIWTIDTMKLASPHLTKLRAMDHIFAKETAALPAEDQDLFKRAVGRVAP